MFLALCIATLGSWESPAWGRGNTYVEYILPPPASLEELWEERHNEVLVLGDVLYRREEDSVAWREVNIGL
jgi:hypothetical protein